MAETTPSTGPCDSLREAISVTLETLCQLWDLADVVDAEGENAWQSLKLRQEAFQLTRILCEQATQVNRELTLSCYPTYGRW